MEISRQKEDKVAKVTHLIREHDTSDTLRVPKQLIDIIITNDAIVVTLPPYKLAVD